ncbi:MAG: hypothetical protein ABSG37_14135, partial [Candidatus Limnocylindrales bacterium]
MNEVVSVGSRRRGPYAVCQVPSTAVTSALAIRFQVLHDRYEGDAEGVQAAAHHQQVDGVSAEAIDLVEPQLLEAM